MCTCLYFVKSMNHNYEIKRSMFIELFMLKKYFSNCVISSRKESIPECIECIFV